MKKIILLIMGIVILTTISQAQNGTFALRGGIGLLQDESIIGYAGAIDLKTANVPVVFSPYIQYFTNNGLNKLYYGVNLQIAKKLSQGFYIGVGGGLTRWDYEKYSRVSPNIGPLLGVRIKILSNLSLFAEGKFFFNTKTNQDTEDFNSGQLINGPLFDNDIILIGGLSFLLK